MSLQQKGVHTQYDKKPKGNRSVPRVRNYIGTGHQTTSKIIQKSNPAEKQRDIISNGVNHEGGVRFYPDFRFPRNV